MSWRDRDPVKKIILDAAEDQHKVTEQLSKATASDPFFPLIHGGEVRKRTFLTPIPAMKNPCIFRVPHILTPLIPPSSSLL